MLPPLYLLTLLIVLTLGVAAFEWQRRRRAHCLLRGLAIEQQLHFSAHDQLRLADRVAAAFPVPGAAYLRVIDLLYGSKDGFYRYFFTAEYTLGAVRSKKRVRRAATFSEPRDRPKDHHCQIRLATHDLPLIEQYRELLK